MAAEGGRPGSRLARRLFEEPWRFDFHQAVRLLERLRPDLRPVGTGERPQDDAVRFRSDPSLAHPPCAVRSLEPSPTGDGPPTLEVSFFGAAGPVGVLAPAYAELLLERQRRGDGALRAFLDFFHHRLLGFFHRAWTKYRFAAACEGDASEAFSQPVRSLLGFAAAGASERAGALEGALLYYAGVAGRRPGSDAVLRGMLEEVLGVEVRLEPLTGGWSPLEKRDRATLGSSSGLQCLGGGLVLGSRIWHPQGAFRLHVGPIPWERLEDLVPPGRGFEAIADLVRFHVGLETRFDVRIRVRAQEARGVRLAPGPAGAMRLGRSSWLAAASPGRDPETCDYSGDDGTRGAVSRPAA